MLIVPQLAITLVRFKDYVEIAKDVVALIAILFGGLWGYFKYWRGRLYRPRLTLKSSAELLMVEARSCLFTTLTIQNIGLSRVDINRDKCWLLVFPQDFGTQTPLIPTKVAEEGEWHHSTFRVFEDRELPKTSSFWIEPGATQTRVHALSLPTRPTCAAYIAEYQIVANRILFRTDALATVHEQATPSRSTHEPNRD